MRIRFPKGKQRAFLEKVIEDSQAPSLRSLLQFGLEVNYSTLKNYYTEQRLLPKPFFIQLCTLIAISPDQIEHQEIKETWGRSKGGKTSKRK